MLQALEVLQRIVQDKPKDDVLVQLVVPVSGEDALFGGLSGLLKTARLEQPRLKGQVVGFEAGASAAQIVALLEASARVPDEGEIRYLNGERQVAAWRELPSGEAIAEAPWRDGGVYLITGGAGGLGVIFAEAIARGAKDTVIVLTGRTELDENRRARLQALEGLGSRIEYRRVDVADGAAVQRTDHVSAGELWRAERDPPCGRGDPRQLSVEEDGGGSQRGAGAEGCGCREPGRSDAGSDAGLHGAVRLLGGCVRQCGAGGLRGGQCVPGWLCGVSQCAGQPRRAVWPDAVDRLAVVAGRRHAGCGRAVMRQHREAGMLPLETSGGLQAFYRALAAGDDGIAVLSGELRHCARTCSSAGRRGRRCDRPRPDGDRSAGAGREDAAPAEGGFGGLTKLKPAKPIDAANRWRAMASILVMILQLNHRLGEMFGELSKTLFFEYPTLAGVTGHLVAEHGRGLRALDGAVRSPARAAGCRRSRPIRRATRAGRPQPCRRRGARRAPCVGRRTRFGQAGS